MPRPKKLNGPATRYVTRVQLLTEMAILARACDASLREMATRLEETEAKLRAEFTEPRSGFTHAEWPQRPPTIPTDSEGAEA